MCGIAGIYRFDGRPVDMEILPDMGERIEHRGPDGKGIYLDREMGLVHRRLKIIDLSDKAHQPMTDSRGDLTISYNGEIYNYIELRKELEEEGFSFRSGSDTEVILAAYARWGVECVRKFNGMFAFALWDRPKRRLFCARDRLGVKPFYYHCNSERFAFASEIKCLLSLPDVPVEANRKLIRDYLVLGLVDHTPETFFAGVRKLETGTRLIVDRKGIREERYWEMEANDEPEENGSVQREAESFRDILTDAIRLRLRSDVPVGTCLSGGIDSTSIVCLIHSLISPRHKERVGDYQKTFSAVSEIPVLDERPFIRLVTAATGAEEHFVFPAAGRFLEELDALLWHQEEPFSSPSVYAQWCVFRCAAQAGVKVVLDGQGADEQLCGYRKFSYFYLRHLFSRRAVGTFLKESLLALANLSFFTGIDLRHSLRYFGPGQRVGGISTIICPEAFPLGEKQNIIGWNGSLARRIALDMTRFSLPSLLRYEDKNSMAFSIESRTPFLDFRLVEYLARLPMDLKIRNGWTKFILRQAMKGIIPEKIRRRRGKLAFDTPQDAWLRNELRLPLSEAFSSKGFISSLLYTGRLSKEFDAFCSGVSRMSGNFFFRAFLLERWSQRFSVGAS
jgi:asparagine synthase (glutamine-hydrolysing)